jgi:hypothetical protein
MRSSGIFPSDPQDPWFPEWGFRDHRSRTSSQPLLESNAYGGGDEEEEEEEEEEDDEE